MTELAGLVLCTLLSVVWGWWAWQEGAYFGVVMLPGAITLCIGAALVAAFAPLPIDLRRSRAVALALASLVGLGLWALASALWSPVPDIAVADGQRILVYALAFGLGIWMCNLLGRRMQLSLVPLTAAAAFAAVATVLALITTDLPRDLLEVDGTLDYPLGYRNANAAFFAIALFPAVGLAAGPGVDWRLRGLALGTATLCIDFALASQSRGSILAMLPALAVFLLFSPARLRALAWLALAAVPALGFVFPVAELYSSVNDEGLRNVAGDMHAAGRAAGFTAIAATILGWICARRESHLPLLETTSPRANRLVALGLAALALLGAVAFVAKVGNPVSWVDERIEEFKTAGSPDLSSESSRFTFNAGSGRYDLWRVALDDAAEDPLLGIGGGGYQYSYTQSRNTPETDARDAHSVEFELLSELGVPGLVLFVGVITGAALGILRARRLGPSAAALGAAALASGTYWLIHTSLDWFWAYPVIAAPVLALLGAACAPAVFVTRGRDTSPWMRRALIVTLALLALSAVPPFLSERYVNDAYAGWRENLDRAYADLDRAGDLNALSDAPLLAEGAIAREAGDTERALEAFRAAAEKRPQEWATHYLLAELQMETEPRAARAEIRTALELNPLSLRVRSLARQLGVEPPRPPA